MRKGPTLEPAVHADDTSICVFAEPTLQYQYKIAIWKLGSCFSLNLIMFSAENFDRRFVLQLADGAGRFGTGVVDITLKIHLGSVFDHLQRRTRRRNMFKMLHRTTLVDQTSVRRANIGRIVWSFDHGVKFLRLLSSDRLKSVKIAQKS